MDNDRIEISPSGPTGRTSLAMTVAPNKQGGLSLLELLVVLAVMALLASLLAPNVAGFLTSGKKKAYNAERETLQLAIDTWRNVVAKSSPLLYPILTGGEQTACLGTIDSLGNPNVAGCNPYLDIEALRDEGFIRNIAAVKSANTSRNTTAKNKPSGSYGWFVNTGALVDSFPPFTDGLFP